MAGGRPFVKGDPRINAQGRPKILRKVEQLAQQHTTSAIATLAEICRDKKAPPNARVMAANSLLERGYGKARQPIEHTGADGELLEAVVIYLPHNNRDALPSAIIDGTSEDWAAAGTAGAIPQLPC